MTESVDYTKNLKLALRGYLLEAGYTPFTQSDWDCYADAALFAGHIDPVIKEEPLTEQIYIYDNNGFHRFDSMNGFATITFDEYIDSDCYVEDNLNDTPPGTDVSL